MGKCDVEVTIESARDLKNVKLLGKMSPYALVHYGDGCGEKRFITPARKNGGRNPIWNFKFVIRIDSTELLEQAGGVPLMIEIFDRGAKKARFVGVAQVLLHPSLATEEGSEEEPERSCHMVYCDKTSQGVLNISAIQRLIVQKYTYPFAQYKSKLQLEDVTDM